jgi:hypothetical protein
MNRKQQSPAILTGLKLKVSCLWILFFTTQLLSAAILWGGDDDSQAVTLKKIRAGRHSDRSYVVFVLENPFQFDKPVLQDDEVRFSLRNVKTTLPSFKKFKISETWVKLTMDKKGLNVRVGLFNKLLKFDYEALTSPDRLAITLYPDESREALSLEDTAVVTADTVGATEASTAGAEERLPAENSRAEEPRLLTTAPRQNSNDMAQAAAPESTGQTRALSVQAGEENLLTLNFYQSDIREILSALAMQQKTNIVTAHDVSGKVSLHLYQVPFDKALNAICQAGGATVPVLRIDESVQQEQSERLAKLKANRDGAAVEQALAAVRDAATAGDNLMPPIIHAASLDATEQELCDVLRSALGTYTDRSEF